MLGVIDTRAKHSGVGKDHSRVKTEVAGALRGD